MTFSPANAAKVMAGTKTVTRRPAKGPCRYVAGKTYAVQPGRGKRAIGRLRVLSVTRVPLGLLSNDEERSEGFGRGEFVGEWLRLYGCYLRDELVDRIEFEVAAA